MPQLGRSPGTPASVVTPPAREVTASFPSTVQGDRLQFRVCTLSGCRVSYAAPPRCAPFLLRPTAPPFIFDAQLRVEVASSSDRAVTFRYDRLVLVGSDLRPYPPTRASERLPLLPAQALLPPGAKLSGFVRFAAAAQPDHLSYVDGGQTLTITFAGLPVCLASIYH